MSDDLKTWAEDHPSTTPGDVDPEHEGVGQAVRGYCIGLGLAALLTVTSFLILGTDLLWGPGIPVGLFVLAVAQMGVHLVFFLHLTTGADNTNNVMALGFGVLIVTIVIGGSIWIMHNLDMNMMLEGMMEMRDAGAF